MGGSATALPQYARPRSFGTPSAEALVLDVTFFSTYCCRFGLVFDAASRLLDVLEFISLVLASETDGAADQGHAS
jgi:hypothetical protein